MGRFDLEGLEHMAAVQSKLAVGLVVGCVGAVVVVLVVCGFCGCGDGGIDEGSDRDRDYGGSGRRHGKDNGEGIVVFRLELFGKVRWYLCYCFST